MVEMAVNAEAHHLGSGNDGLGQNSAFIPAAFDLAPHSQMLSVCHLLRPDPLCCSSASYCQHRTDLPRAFSTVVANNQFATLGVVLLATLARLVRATGIDYEADVRPQPRAQKPTILVSSKEDRGERVCRNEAGALPKPPKVPTSAPVEKSARDNSHTKRGKKASKRKKNAIDELFSGLF